MPYGRFLSYITAVLKINTFSWGFHSHWMRVFVYKTFIVLKINKGHKKAISKISRPSLIWSLWIRPNYNLYIYTIYKRPMLSLDNSIWCYDKYIIYNIFFSCFCCSRMWTLKPNLPDHGVQAYQPSQCYQYQGDTEYHCSASCRIDHWRGTKFLTKIKCELFLTDL